MQKIFSGLRLDTDLTDGLDKASAKLSGGRANIPARELIRMYIREGLIKDGILPRPAKERHANRS